MEEFANRGQQPVNRGPSVPGEQLPSRHSSSNSKKISKDKWYRMGVFAAVICVVALLVGLIFVVTSNNSNSNDESKYIYTNKLQAVFLNTGQVYFGNVKVLNDKYLVLTNIFYLQTSGTSGSAASSTSSSSNSNVTLVKLGCELHQPYDQMVINDSQVTFWENLQSTGQVAQAVQKFNLENPHGQKCSDQSSSASTTSTNTTQNAPSGSSSTNP
jgi:hypothetical protein